MVITRIHVLPLAVVMCAAGLAGCGERPTDAMWTDALILHMDIEDEREFALEQGNRGEVQDLHALMAEALDRVLRRYPDGSAELRAVLETIRDGERRIAEGQVSGAEAEALRERHEQYWAELHQRRLPPDLD